jgi:hypothetical protein
MENAMRMQYSPISLLRKDVRGDMMSSERIENSSGFAVLSHSGEIPRAHWIRTYNLMIPYQDRNIYSATG